MVTLTLRIENNYELYDDVTTEVTVTVPAPPLPRFSDAWCDWVDHYIGQETGTGKVDGDSWYDVEVIASSDPALVGETFDFGY